MILSEIIYVLIKIISTTIIPLIILIGCAALMIDFKHLKELKLGYMETFLIVCLYISFPLVFLFNKMTIDEVG